MEGTRLLSAYQLSKATGCRGLQSLPVTCSVSWRPCPLPRLLFLSSSRNRDVIAIRLVHRVIAKLKGMDVKFFRESTSNPNFNPSCSFPNQRNALGSGLRVPLQPLPGAHGLFSSPSIIVSGKLVSRVRWVDGGGVLSLEEWKEGCGGGYVEV